MSPKEIAEKAMSDGVIILMRDRTLIERPPSRGRPDPLPLTKDFAYCVTIDEPYDCVPDDDADVCLIKAGPLRKDWYWISWEGYGIGWCFATDSVLDIRPTELKDALDRRRYG